MSAGDEGAKELPGAGERLTEKAGGGGEGEGAAQPKTAGEP